ncbi:MAG: SIS domain-containing protein [Planctomycetota bacterium]|jgi:glucose/mannose-6-phosphate isomerase
MAVSGTLGQGNNPDGSDYAAHIKTLVDGPSQQRRRAVSKLIADAENKSRIVEDVKRIIEECSPILYEDTPQANEPERYEAMARASGIEQAAIQTALGILGPDGLLDARHPFVKLIDRSGMLKRLGAWENHVRTMKANALKAVKQFKEKHDQKEIKYVAVFGLGGSGAPHDIARNIISNWRKSSVKIDVIHADEPNPDYIDENTLAVFCSFSGTTEETINCYNAVRDETARRVVLAKPDDPKKPPEISLAQIAQRDSLPFIQLPADKKHPAYVMQPRESVCLQLTAILTFLASMELEPGSGGSLALDDLAFEKKIVPKINEWRLKFGPDVDYKENPAKQLAFFLLYGIDYEGGGSIPDYDMWRKKVPCVLVDRNNWAIGHEIRTQLHERSKINAIFYEAPEFLHNLVESIRAGAESAQAGLDEDPYVYYFIRSLDEEPRIRLRLNKTIKLVVDGKGRYAELNAEADAEPENPFQQALHAVYFNAHVATYMAILNGFDPLPVPTMSWLKNVMNESVRDGKEEKQAQNQNSQVLTMHLPSDGN